MRAIHLSPAGGAFTGRVQPSFVPSVVRMWTTHPDSSSRRLSAAYNPVSSSSVRVSPDNGSTYVKFTIALYFKEWDSSELIPPAIVNHGLNDSVRIRLQSISNIIRIRQALKCYMQYYFNVKCYISLYAIQCQYSFLILNVICNTLLMLYQCWRSAT